MTVRRIELLSLFASVAAVAIMATAAESVNAQAAVVGNTCNGPLPEANTTIPINGSAIFPVITGDGCWIFVSVRRETQAGGVQVLHRDKGELRQVRYVPLTPPQPGQPWDMALTRDAKTLIVAADRQVIFLDAPKLISGDGSPLLGVLVDRRLGGTNSVMVTPDDRYLLVGNAWTSLMVVVDLGKALSTNFAPESIIGSAEAAGGRMVVSPEQRHILMSSADIHSQWPAKCAVPGDPASGPRQREGGFLVFDGARLTTSPSTALLHAVALGCDGVPIALSPDGRTLYGGGDQSVSVFDAAPLQDGRPPRLITRIPVGGYVRNLITVDRGKRLVAAVAPVAPPVAQAKDRAALVFIDTGKVASGAAAILGSVQAGVDALGMRVTPDERTLLVTNRISGTLQVINLERVALEPMRQAGVTDPDCNRPMTEPIVHVDVRGGPWSAVATNDGCWVFMAIGGGGSNPFPRMNGIEVLRRSAGAITPVRFVPTPGKMADIALTRDEKLLLVPAGPRVALLSVDKLLSGDADPMTGFLGDERDPLGGAGAVSLSADGQLAFVTERETARVSMFDLDAARRLAPGGAIRATARIPLGGFGQVAVSPDARYLYATSLLPPEPYRFEGSCRGTTFPGEYRRPGALMVMELNGAAMTGKAPVVATVAAGCGPKGVTVSPDGGTVYVTANEDDRLLAFDVRNVPNGVAPTLKFASHSGPMPALSVVFDGGRRIIVVNSFETETRGMPEAHPMTMIDTATGREIGSIPTRRGPAKGSVTRDGRTLLLANREAGTLEIVDLQRVTTDPAPASAGAR